VCGAGLPCCLGSGLEQQDGSRSVSGVGNRDSHKIQFGDIQTRAGSWRRGHMCQLLGLGPFLGSLENIHETLAAD